MRHHIQRFFSALAVGTCMVAQNTSAMNCMPTSSLRLAFGQYDPQAGSVKAQTILLIECTPAYAGEPLDLTVSFAEPLSMPLMLQNAATGEKLPFGLYRDTAHTQPVDWQSLLSVQTPLRSPVTISIPLYAQIPAAQDVSVGSYQLSLPLLLRY